MENGRLYLQSPASLALSSVIKAQALLPARAGEERLSAELKLKILEPLFLTNLLEKRLQACFGQVCPHLYAAQLQPPLDYAHLLAQLLEPLPRAHELRPAQLPTARGRVVSREVPRLRAKVIEVFSTGFELLSDAAVDAGRTLPFEIDSATHPGKPVAVVGRVSSCRPEAGSTFRLRVQFAEPDAARRAKLQQAVAALLAAE